MSKAYESTNLLLALGSEGGVSLFSNSKYALSGSDIQSRGFIWVRMTILIMESSLSLCSTMASKPLELNSAYFLNWIAKVLALSPSKATYSLRSLKGTFLSSSMAFPGAVVNKNPKSM